MRIHLIAIGGAVMHNLALELQHNGHVVSGSDDDIFEPSRTRLLEAGLLPAAMGWYPERITDDLDMVILGMHARADNPELIRALELMVPVLSFPEYIAKQSHNKTRLVVCGSHGKTTTTAMIMHVLRQLGRDFDYLVGSRLEGFERMVRLSDAPCMVIEGDEYLSSAIDPRPKFLWYDPHIAIITGIAWDHVNVFPTYELYKEQFAKLIQGMRPDSILFWFGGDPDLSDLCSSAKCLNQAYLGLQIVHNQEITEVQYKGRSYPMQVFGAHNFQNMEAAVLALGSLGINPELSLEALMGFKGTARRMEAVYTSDNLRIFRDFAHSPSKVRASVAAFREAFPGHRVTAVLELHTYSSLSSEFLPLYAHSMDPADRAAVFYSPGNLVKKQRTPFSPEDVNRAFGEVEVFTEIPQLIQFVGAEIRSPSVFLLMSSGSFEGADLIAEIRAAHGA